MRPTSPPHFAPVSASGRIGRLSFAGLSLPACDGQDANGDGIWIERDRIDRGVHFLLVDIQGHGLDTVMLKEVLESTLRDTVTRNRAPADLLLELHSQVGAVWADLHRFFMAQVVIIYPEQSCALIASSGVPYPYQTTGERWQMIPIPALGPTMLGRPDLFEPGEPKFLTQRIELTPGHTYLGFTDGITEAGRPAIWSDVGILHYLNDLAGIPAPDELLRLVFDKAAQHDGDTWPGDDCTGLAWRLD